MTDLGLSLFVLHHLRPHLFQQVAGKDKVGKSFVCRLHDVAAHALPFFIAFVYEDDVLAYGGY